MMNQFYGSDYGIACCVSAMRIGKDMQASRWGPRALFSPWFGTTCNASRFDGVVVGNAQGSSRARMRVRRPDAG